MSSQDSSEALIEVQNSGMENLGSYSDDDDGYVEVVLWIPEGENQEIEEEKETKKGLRLLITFIRIDSIDKALQTLLAI